jgi:hypothetical protein
MMTTSTLLIDEANRDQVPAVDSVGVHVDRLRFRGCATAKTAQQTLIGWSELDLEACLGAPDQQSMLGDTDILTYYGNSTSNKSFSLGLPFLGGFSLASGGGGYCHAVFRIKDGRIAEVRYNGETNATPAPDAYCAPIVRDCVQQPEHLQASPPTTSKATSGDAPETPR